MGGARAASRLAMLSSMSLVLASCLSQQTFYCAEKLCPDGTVCDELRATCLLREQVEACHDLDELDPCGYSGVPDGRCLSGACFAVSCGNGVLDHEGEVCDDGNVASGDGCASDCRSNETCGNGIVDLAIGETCDDGNAAPDDGCNPVCLVEACGNGYVDVGETCDDGNVEAGDGCSNDCLSLEECGNGYADLLAGDETCDDGDNHQYNDGCSDNCLAEVPTWTLERFDEPLPRADAGMAYDFRRGGALLFGGRQCDKNTADCLLADTWFFQGGAWRQLTVFAAPDPRTAEIVYDAARGVFVLFGGQSISYGSFNPGIKSDTWEFDGREWIPRQLANEPQARTDHAMAYDSARKRTVLFGGRRTTAPGSAGTYEYDGTAWELIAGLDPKPSPRYGHDMAYDPKRGVMVLFGGRVDKFGEPGPLGVLDDTWEYDGTSWTEIVVTVPPEARVDHTLVWDPVRETVVLFGGRASNNALLTDAYEWDGSTWSALPPLAQSPAARADHAAGYDVFKEELLLFGGEVATGYSRVLWKLATDEELAPSWNDHPSPEVPPAMARHSLAYDSRRGALVLFGGQPWIGDGVQGLPASETYEYDGYSWHKVTVSSGVASRADHASAYDALAGVTLRAGGYGGFGTRDTEAMAWSGDGSEWQSIEDAPSATTQPAMAYDAAAAVSLLCDDNQAYAFDGSSWSSLGATLAGARFSMAYDAVRQRIVAAAGSLASTFEWDGAQWIDTTPAQPVPKRRDAALAFDGSSGRTILFGGFQGGLHYAETWAYNGNTWEKLEVSGAPGPRRHHAMAYHAAQRKLVVFGGADADDSTDETWSFRYQGPTPDEVCTTGWDSDGDGLIGCDDPDCWGYCTPSCPPAAPSCDDSLPHCGDGVCDPIEASRVCTADCGALPVRCGDFLCEGDETAETCPGDCTP